MRDLERHRRMERISDEHAWRGAGVRAQSRHIRRDHVFQDRRGVGVVSGRGVMPCRRPGDLGRKDRMLRRHQLRGMEFVQSGADEIDRRLGRALPQLDHRRDAAAAAAALSCQDAWRRRGFRSTPRRALRRSSQRGTFSAEKSCIFSCGSRGRRDVTQLGRCTADIFTPGYIGTDHPGKFAPGLWSIHRLPLTPGFQRAFVPAAQRNMINECERVENHDAGDG